MILGTPIFGEGRFGRSYKPDRLLSEKNIPCLPHAAFFPCLTLAHLARCAAAILRLAEADMVRFLEASAMPFTLAQRAF
jgi:hypothetical protein